MEGNAKGRSVYITVGRQIRYGATEGCKGCHSSDEEPKRHSAACRRRFEALIARETSAKQPKAADLEPGKRLKIAMPVQQPGEGPGNDGARPGDAASGSGSSGSGLKRRSESENADGGKEPRLVANKGEKRAAETPLEDIDPEAACSMPEVVCALFSLREKQPVSEVISGLPTIHEENFWTPLAGYPEWGGLHHGDEAFDERTGAKLPHEKVIKARERELNKMIEHDVKSDMTWEVVKMKKLKIVRSRWVDGWKALPDDEHGVRSRCVAQEINNGPRDDVYAGTPPLKAHRIVLSSAATRRPGSPNHTKLVARYDVSVAFFHAKGTGGIAVIPPKDVYDGEHLWYLNKAMNGTREASKQWTQYVIDSTTAGGFQVVKSVPGLYFHPEWMVTLSCHGDDFLAEGEGADLDKLDELMKQHFEVKILDRIGPAEYGGQVAEGLHLHRRIAWVESPVRGFTWEADPKYAPQIIKDLGLENAKGQRCRCSMQQGHRERRLQGGDSLGCRWHSAVSEGGRNRIVSVLRQTEHPVRHVGDLLRYE